MQVLPRKRGIIIFIIFIIFIFQIGVRSLVSGVDFIPD